MNQQFLSFMTGSSSAGALTVRIETYDLLANVTLTLSVSGITSTETTSSLANKVYTQLSTYLVQQERNYPNTPPKASNSTIEAFLSYAEQAMVGMFNVTWTDHVVCIASQCDFAVSLTTNTTGSLIEIDSHPVLLDLAAAQTLNTVWEDDSGTALTNQQIINLLKYSSARLVAHLRNNIVLTTYLHNEICSGSDSIQFAKRPVRDFLPPHVRCWSVWSYVSSKYNFALDRRYGILKYGYSQPLVKAYEPFDYGNEVLIAYVSGYTKIPTILQQIVVDVSTSTSINSDYKSMAADGSKFEFFAPADTWKEWAIYLSEYYCA